MVRCQRSIGSWCLFSKWCPCYCSKRQASVGCKYTLFPCMMPLSKCTFQTFSCLLSKISFFFITFPPASLPPGYCTEIRPIQVIQVNNPFRRKQNFLCTTVVIAILSVVVCQPSMFPCNLNNVTKTTINMYLVYTITPKCSYLPAWEIVNCNKSSIFWSWLHVRTVEG